MHCIPDVFCATQDCDVSVDIPDVLEDAQYIMQLTTLACYRQNWNDKEFGVF